ncbi:SpoIIE family protein phosphatase [Kitasatospora sp. RB6PN24]|uniref:PP2C family protein-serine/threonine phosphatase n=1 Tax=Kitasatospora humi TaxID=2893891 RepID=UPI001E5C4C58|nr:SpoIIE family protein phosphatase [Kitasatospora humi]MCC9307913.1 SpoIIE family protein phosphatase [Kitasatospora humi]
MDGERPATRRAQPPVADAAHSVAQLADEVARLREELARQHLLSLAAGVLVDRYALEPADAAERLVSLAEDTGQRPEDFAADLLNQAVGPSPAVATAAEPVGASRRVRRTGELAGARESLDEVAETLLSEALGPLGACGVLLWRRSAGDCLELVGGAGLGALERTHWRWIPPLWPGPLRRVHAEGRPLWLPRGPTAPDRLPGPSEAAARAVLPLRGDQGPLGVMLVCWPQPTELAEDLRHEVLMLSQVARRVLSAAQRRPDYRSCGPLSLPVLTSLLDVLANPALLVHSPSGDGEPLVEHANQAARRAGTGLLGSVPRPLGQLLPYAAPLLRELIARAQETQAVQIEAQLPAGRRPGEPGTLTNVRVLPVEQERTAVLWHPGGLDHSSSALRVVGGLAGLGAFEDDVAAGTSRWTEHTFELLGLALDAPPRPLADLGPLFEPEDARALAGAVRRLMNRQENVTLVVRVRRPEGGLRQVRIIAEPVLTDGALTGIAGIFQDVSAQHRTEVALEATFDQLTTVREQSAVRHRLALQLQQAIVPEVPDLRKLPGLQVAARYRPAGQEYRVGGDWYDVLPLPGGPVMMAVGDVAGHGIEAATGMVALRNALRGLALTGEPPARLLGWLNEVALNTSGQPTATGVCAVYDPARRSLVWASAGHLPPVLLRGGTAVMLEPTHNILLGALPESTYHETVTPLRAQDTLFLYTDGLIERRDTDLGGSLTELRDAVQALDPADVAEQADRLLARSTGDTEDDTSLVVIRIL